jgi:hypothetical protein
MAQQLKTADYTRRASKNYRDKHDYMNITLEKGEADKFRSVGINPSVIRELIRAEYKRRTGETEEATNSPEPFMPEPEEKVSDSYQEQMRFFDE